MNGLILINYRNRGGYSHEFGLMPRLVGGDSQIQAISLLFSGCNTYCQKQSAENTSAQKTEVRSKNIIAC